MLTEIRLVGWLQHCNFTLCLTMQDAPYLLEACAQGFTNEEDQVQLALLSAAMKLFFKRPPECQQLLGVTLAAASAESSQDVHDRALLYYRSALVAVGMLVYAFAL